MLARERGKICKWVKWMMSFVVVDGVEEVVVVVTGAAVELLMHIYE